MILLLILLISLCVSALSYTQHRQRIYRGRTQTQQGVNVNNNRPYNDEPPKYSDVTQTNRNMEEGKFDRYKNKGKELLAKVYLVK